VPSMKFGKIGFEEWQRRAGRWRGRPGDRRWWWRARCTGSGKARGGVGRTAARQRGPRRRVKRAVVARTEESARSWCRAVGTLPSCRVRPRPCGHRRGSFSALPLRHRIGNHRIEALFDFHVW
jgi:hypothetical protein